LNLLLVSLKISTLVESWFWCCYNWWFDWLFFFFFCGFVVAGREELISDLSNLVRSFAFNLIFSFHSVWLLRKFFMLVMQIFCKIKWCLIMWEWLFFKVVFIWKYIKIIFFYFLKFIFTKKLIEKNNLFFFCKVSRTTKTNGS